MRYKVARQTIAASLICSLAWSLHTYTAIAADTPAIAPEPKQMADGEAIAKKTCQQCHGAAGQGDIGPPLRQNVADIKGVVRVITEGKGDMPPFAQNYSDLDIANVLTFVRNSWGNSFGAVSEQQVAAARK
jgi:mono/diheme cytochrome c family protein